MDSLKVAIVGGGIGGLSAAYYLFKAADGAGLAVDVSVYEAEGRWGGKINTVSMEGFLVEEGPDSFLTTKPWALELCEELGISDQLIPTLPSRHRTYILSRGRLFPLPGGLIGMLPADLRELMASPLFTRRGKLRMLFDLILPARRAYDDESLHSLISRRLGEEVYSKLFGPLMGGVYGANGSELSVQAVLPHLLELEARYGSLLLGANQLYKQNRRERANKGVGDSSPFLAPRQGMRALVDSLLAKLEGGGVSLYPGHALTKLTKPGKRYALHFAKSHVSDHSLAPSDKEADAVILAAPAYVVSNWLVSIDNALAEDLARIEFAPSVTVSLAFHSSEVPRPFDAHGYLIPKSEGRTALACTWVSSKFPGRSPKNKILCRLFFNQIVSGDAGDSDGSHYIDLARREIGDTLGIKASPRLAHAKAWGRAMPQYKLGHLKRVEEIEKKLGRHPGLYLVGNSYRGIGIPDTIHRSKEIAGEFLQWARRRMQEKIPN
ncbi:MAG: protoporphyrinogen oxidase [Anaerolineales bacterium]